MQAEIIRINPIKDSTYPNQKFIRIEFKTKDRKVYFMDLVRKDGKWFRNVARWKPYLKIGTVLYGLQLLDETHINADSWPSLRTNPEMSLEDEKLMNLAKQVGM